MPPPPPIPSNFSIPDAQAVTRRRILDAAGEVFAAHGFRNATIREICSRAGANIAGVNYHFGDKERLYREVLLDSAALARERFPLDGGPNRAKPPTVDPQAAIAIFVRAFIGKLFDPGRPAWHAKLISREMSEPTGALEEVAERYMKPDFARLKKAVAALLGPKARPTQVRHCASSIIAQCIFYHHCRPGAKMIMPEQEYDLASLDALAEHIIAFSLGAIASLRSASTKAAPQAAKSTRGRAQSNNSASKSTTRRRSSS
jgi:TetR/AcrR family transcriptional regulator, regulator of cefoperazone and chloramphenicol sensitivity